jgi:hypothetical protein
MSRPKRKSVSIDAAAKRASGLVSIDPQLDLGSGNTLAAFQKKISDTQDLLDGYNTKLGELDAAQNDLEAAESGLEAATSAMLTAVGLKYGKDSNEYEQAGGTRTSERKPSGPRAKPKAKPAT